MTTAPAPLSIVSCAPVSFAGGSTIHRRLLALFASHGQATSLVAFDTPHLRCELEQAGVAVHIVDGCSDAYPVSSAIQSALATDRLLREARGAAAAATQPVLIGSFLWPWYQAVFEAATLLGGEGLRCTAICIPTGSDIWQVGARTPALTRRLLSARVTRAIVAYSRSFAQELLEAGAPPDRLHVIPPPLDVSRFHPLDRAARARVRKSLGLPVDAFVMLHCSNMRPVKGVHHTAAIAASVAERVSVPVVLCLVGPLANSPHLFERSSSRVRIQHVGLVADTAPYHQAADVAINTSYHDSFNISLLESMACGIPAVTSSVAGIADLIGRFEAGFVFDFPAPVEAFTRGGSSLDASLPLPGAVEFIVRLVRDAAERDRLGNCARVAVVQTSSSEVVWRQWRTLLQDVTS
jgi:hypothetical protein